MKTKLFQLNNTEACKRRRAFAIETNDKAEVYKDRAALIKRVAVSWAKDLYSIKNNEAITEEQKTKMTEEMEAQKSSEIKEGFDSLRYLIPKTRELLCEDAVKIARRYAECESDLPHKWEMFSGKDEMDIQLSSDLTVEGVKPDFIDYDKNPVINNDEEVLAEGTLRVIKVSATKPKITQKAAEQSLELYTLLQYGKEVLRKKLKEGHKIKVEACAYYLRKKNDSNGSKPNFDEDFFMEKGGNNIVRLSDIYEKPAAGAEEERTELEKNFDEVIKDFVEGKDQGECSEDDCANCDLHEACKYTLPPVPITKVSEDKKVGALRLSKEQREAINFKKGVLRINAGAGSGKTVVVAFSPVNLLLQGVRPEEILLTTFSNSGTEEIATRTRLYLEDVGLGEDFEKLRITTFNAFGNDCLKMVYKDLGFSDEPKVIDDIDKYGIITDLLANNPIDGFDFRNPEMNMKTNKGVLPMIAMIFDIMKKGHDGVSYGVSDVDKIWDAMGMNRRFMRGGIETLKQVCQLYDLYDEKLREQNLIEFSDQEVLLFEYLRKDPKFFERFGFKHLIVDEFQDSSSGQIELLKRLCACPSFESLRVIGDDSQAIFGFRDTTPEYMMNFEKIMAEEGLKVEDTSLVNNYRCTPQIIEFANRLVSRNKFRMKKELKATRKPGAPVSVQGFYTQEEELQYVISGIQEHLDKGFKPEDIAVICYSRWELMAVASALTAVNIPSVMMNPENLLSNGRVLAAIALINAITNPEDTKDLLTYVNARLDGQVFDLPEEEVREEMDAVLEEIETLKSLKDKDRKEMLLDMLYVIDQDDDEVYQSFLEKVEYKRSFKSVVNYVDKFKTFGANVTYRRAHDYPGVVLTTAHSSKGLEWKVVYNMITKYDSEDDSNGGESRSEEKRRLLFVSSTRARDELYITAQYYTGKKKDPVTEETAGTRKKKKDELLNNSFLMEAYECLGKEFDPQKIAEEKASRDAEAKKAKTEQRAARLKERVAARRAAAAAGKAAKE